MSLSQQDKVGVIVMSGVIDAADLWATGLLSHNRSEII